MGSLAAAAGVTTVNLAGAAASDTDIVTVLAGFTNNLTVDFDSDANVKNTVDATACTKSLTITAAASDLDSRAASIVGGTGSDTLKITADDASNAAITPNLGAMSKIETIQILNNVAASITLEDVNVVGTSTSSETITVDATALTSAVATVNADAEDDGKVVINTGGGADVITVSSSYATGTYGDSISSGAGNDSIRVKADVLTSADTIDGGAGTDSLIITADQSLADSDFTNLTSIETLDGSAASIAFTSLTIGAQAAEAGIATINLSDSAAAESVTFESGFNKDVTIVLDADGATNTIDASALAAGNTVTISAGTATLDASDSVNTTITGGSGTEILEITTNGTALTADDFDQITAVDTIKLLGSAAQTITLSDASATYTHASDYVSYAVDASAMTAAATIDAKAEADAKLTITGSANNDVITATTSANFGDNISAGAGNDTIHIHTNASLTNIDTIAGGAGDDTMSFTADATLTDAVFANVSSIKTLDMASSKEFSSLTLGSNALAAGIDTVTFAGGNAASKVILGSGYTGTLGVTMTDADVNDTIDGSASAGAVSVTVGNLAYLEETDVVKGGTGTSDSITVTAAASETAYLTLVSGVETVTVASGASADAAAVIEMGANDTQIAAGKTLTVDATDLAASGETLTFTGTASETDGFLSITGGGLADTIIGARRCRHHRWWCRC